MTYYDEIMDMCSFVDCCVCQGDEKQQTVHSLKERK